MPKAPNIFISYRSTDRALVETLADNLTKLSYKVWFDKKLVGGQIWWEEILVQIRCCDIFIFALTPSALESEACRLEYEYALALSKNFLVVGLRPVYINLLPKVLYERQIVNYEEPNANNIIDLVRALNEFPSRRSLPDPLPPQPPVPMSPLTSLSSKLEKEQLTLEEQILILDEIMNLLENDTFPSEAKALLDKLKRHRYLYATVERKILEINTLYSGKPTTRAISAPKSLVTLQPYSMPSIDTKNVTNVFFSPVTIFSYGEIINGAVLTLTKDGLISWFDIASLRQIHTDYVDGNISSAETFSNNSLLVAHNAKLSLVGLSTFDIEPQQDQYFFDKSTHYSPDGYSMEGMSLSPDKQTLATVGIDGILRVWRFNLKKLDEIAFLKPSAPFSWKNMFSMSASPPIYCVKYRFDGRILITGGEDKEIHFWDLETKNMIRSFEGHQKSVYDLDYSPDNQTIASASGDGTARVWDISTGKEIFVLEGHTGIVRRVKYNPTGRYIATASFDCTCRIWDAYTGNQVCQLIEHTGFVNDICFSSDNKYLITGSSDGTAKVWDLSNLF